MSHPDPSAGPAPRHPIPVRDVSLPFDASIPRHWFGGNAVQTHLFNGLNLVFPDGERFFIQAVRDHLPRVQDPELRRQIRGFFGQEAHHAREHERFFEILGAQGYRVEGFLRRFRAFARFTGRRLPASLRLSMTAAAEHYTATLGHFALTEAHLEEAHPTLARLIAWHAVEEIEHKAVAYDVLQATHPSYALRLVGFALSTAVLFGWWLAGARLLLRQDGLSGRALREQRRALRRRDGGRMPRALWRGLRAYLRRDFHPSQVDDLPLARARLAELELAA